MSFRADGSSRFLKENRKQWSYFPSVGLSWNVNEEGFLREVKKLSNLKVRLSVGATGNQEIGDYRAFALQTPLNYSFNYNRQIEMYRNSNRNVQKISCSHGVFFRLSNGGMNYWDIII